MDYVYDIGEKTFGVYSDMANIDYIVVLNSKYFMPQAMAIAEKEMKNYVTLEPENEDYEYYYQVGYIECVRKALIDNGIGADYYDKV